MKDGRATILIYGSMRKKDLQESTEERILNHLLNIAKSEPKEGQATEKRAEEMIEIIEDPKNTEADIISILEKMERSQKLSETK